MSPSANGATGMNWNFGGAFTTFNGWQYLAYWNNDGASNGGKYHVSVARRKLSAGKWEVLTLTDYARNQDTGTGRVAARFGDGHEKVALGISPDGIIHLAFDHHVDRLHYRRSLAPIANTPDTSGWDQSLFGPTQDNLGGGAIGDVTYPNFTTDAAHGKFNLYLRTRGSGSGDSHLFTYSNGTWTINSEDASRYIDNVTKRADGTVNAYPQGMVVRGEHIYQTWVWRTTPNAATNFDLCYAFSTDSGNTWRNGANVVIGSRGAPNDTDQLINADDDGLAGISLGEGSIRNNGSMTMDENKNIHVVVSGPGGNPVHYMWTAKRDAGGVPMDHGGVWSSARYAPSLGKLVAGPNNRLYLVTKSGLHETDASNPVWTTARVADAPAGLIDGPSNQVVDTSRVKHGVISVVGQNDGTAITCIDYHLGGQSAPH